MTVVSVFDTASGEYVKGGSAPTEQEALIQASNSAEIVKFIKASPYTHFLNSRGDVQEYTQEQSYIKRNAPFIGAIWSNITLQWEDSRTPEQRLQEQWALIRTQRDQLLSDTDWRVIRAVDTGEPLSSSWKAYRQALRDVTLQSDPYNIIWPETPSA